MSGGAIDGREIDAVTINADMVSVIYTFDDGYKICLHAKPAKVTLPGNKFPFVVPDGRGSFFVKPSCASFSVPSKGGCVS